MPTALGYRTMDEIRAEADCEYHVFFNSHNDGSLVQTRLVANDHEDALNQCKAIKDCDEVRLILKGDFLVLWMG